MRTASLCELLLLATALLLAGAVLPQELPRMQVPDVVVAPIIIPSVSGRTSLLPPQPPSIIMDLPLSVVVGRPFNLDVWLDPSTGLESGAVKVSFEQTNRMSYEPRIFDLRLGRRQTVHARVLESPSGLVEITATVNGRATQSVIVNAGFSGHLKSDLGEFIEGAETRSFGLEFVNNSGNPIPLDAPSKLTLQVTNALLRRKNSDNWSDRLDLTLGSGASSSPLLQIRSESFSQDTSLLLAELRINDKYVIHSDKFQIAILPRWWLLLLMGILGGLLHSLYETTREITTAPRYSIRLFLRRGVPRIVAGMLAGVLSYLLASYNILGVDIKTTSLRGFVILGFLFSYVGIDLILKKLSPAHTQTHDPPITSG